MEESKFELPYGIKLPEIFYGSPRKELFSQWFRRLEVTLETIPERIKPDITLVLPSRLGGPAFNVWDELPDSSKKKTLKKLKRP